MNTGRKKGLGEQEERALTDLVHHRSHLVELVGTYVGAVRETEVDEGPLAQEVLVRERFSILSLHLKRTTDQGTADGAGFAIPFCQFRRPTKKKFRDRDQDSGER